MRDPTTLDPASLRDLLPTLPGPDRTAAEAARRRDRELTKPAGALGRLEDLAAFLAAWQGRHPPRLERVRVAVFAGWHGVARQGVSAYPAEVTAQMVANFRAGGAAINQLAALAGAELAVEAVFEGVPTEDFTQGPAMTPDTLAAALAAGAAQAEPGSTCWRSARWASPTPAPPPPSPPPSTASPPQSGPAPAPASSPRASRARRT